MIIGAGAYLFSVRDKDIENNNVVETKFGNFLAAQHAMYVNDFDSASKFLANIPETDNEKIKSTKILSDFFSGVLPSDIESLSDSKTSHERIIYDAYLVKNKLWKELWTRHQDDESVLFYNFRVWSGVATNNIKNTIKYVEKMETTPDLKLFTVGQIYAESGDIDKAVESFSAIKINFLNINDYLYLMSFYKSHNLEDLANKLYQEFTESAGGIFLVNYTGVQPWEMYSGIENQLAFSLIQTVSHTKIMTFSDLSLLLLRFAEIVSMNSNKDAINYYIGQFVFNTSGDYQKYFGEISKYSPFYPFVKMRINEKTNDISELKQMVKNNPLFVPGVTKLVAYQIKTDNKSGALKPINNALKQKGLSNKILAILKKMRAQVYYTFGDIKKAQSDLHDASSVLVVDENILSLQAKIWATENRELDSAYDYAMQLIQKAPMNVCSWDTLGYVVHAREGVDAALDLVERVAEISNECSVLFEHLGDYYVEIGEKDAAQEAYSRAIELSDDGLVIVSNIEKKIRKLK